MITGAALLFVWCGYYLGRDAGIKIAMKAMDQTFERIVKDINAGRSLDWLNDRED